jgi:hypothetical protein
MRDYRAVWIVMGMGERIGGAPRQACTDTSGRPFSKQYHAQWIHPELERFDR